MTKHYTLTEKQAVHLFTAAAAYLATAKVHDPGSYDLALPTIMEAAEGMGTQHAYEEERWTQTIERIVQMGSAPVSALNVGDEEKDAICVLATIAIALSIATGKDSDLDKSAREATETLIKWGKSIDARFGHALAQACGAAHLMGWAAGKAH